MGLETALIIGGSLLSAGVSSRGASRAASTQAQGNQLAIDESRRQFDELLRLTGPQRQFGDQAINELSRLFGFDTGQPNQLAFQGGGGVGGVGAGGGPRGRIPFGVSDSQGRLIQPGLPGGTNEVFGTGPQGEQPTGLDVFQASPDFEFRRGEGLEGIAQTLGAGGAGAFSGNALRELNRFNSNLASGEFGDFINRRLAAAGLGQTATSQAGQGALTTGLSVGNALQNQGNARASGILGQTAAGGNLIKDLLEAILAGRGGGGEFPTLGPGGPPV